MSNGCKVYKVGTAIYIEATFTDPFTNLPVDPVTVLFSLQPKGGVVETHDQADPAVSHPSTGVYVCIFDPLAESTKYWWQVESGGVYAVMEDGNFDVANTHLT